MSMFLASSVGPKLLGAILLGLLEGIPSSGLLKRSLDAPPGVLHGSGVQFASLADRTLALVGHRPAVGFRFPFPSLRKVQCVVQAGELTGSCPLPNCTASPSSCSTELALDEQKSSVVLICVSHSQETTAL